MAANAELGILLTAKDLATATFRGFVAGGLSTLIGGLSDAANAAAADEANMATLQRAIENSGVAYGDVADAIEHQIKKGQDLAFTDTQVRDSLALLVTSSGSVDKAMELQVTAMDIARLKHVDLATASLAVGKAAEGNSTSLGRMIGVIDKNASAAEILAEVQKRTAGQAELYGSSTQAAIFKVHDAVDEWRESIGHAMGPAMGLIALLPGMQSGFIAISSAGAAMSTLIRGPMIASFLASIPVTWAAMAPFIPFVLVIAAVAAAILLLKLAWDNNLGGIQEKTAAVIEFVTGLFNAFVGFFTGLWNALPGPIQAAIDVITAPIRGLIELVQTAIGWLNALGSANANSQTYNAQAGGVTTGGGDYVPVYDEGTPYVPRTGLAIVHKGERITPADQNQGGEWGGGVHIHFDGPVYGMQDFEDKVTSIFRDRRLAGGFRGV